ncbi:hypothetical protein [Gracilimonas halophila]|uniref:Uncharacterized protein n=1 Tax=Gracilimonas halophila TaxID=1834464 RepID=A0ABW5JIM9_9BACT
MYAWGLNFYLRLGNGSEAIERKDVQELRYLR